MAINFPTIVQPSYPFNIEYANPAIKGEMEDNTIVTRPRYTKMPIRCTLRWTGMPNDDYDTLRAFYKKTLGGSVAFNWIYPSITGDELSDTIMLMRFSDSSFNFSYDQFGRWSGQIILEEVL